MKLINQCMWAISISMLISSASYAKDQGTYQVTINGTIIDPTCSVSSGSQAATVNMGTLASKSFTRAGDSAPPVPFSLELEHCPSTLEGVAIYFDGKPDGVNNQLLSLNSGTGTAGGIAIALLDGEKTAIPIQSQTKFYSLAEGTSGLKLSFYAQYIATGAAVTPGNANASSTFTLKYP